MIPDAVAVIPVLFIFLQIGYTICVMRAFECSIFTRFLFFALCSACFIVRGEADDLPSSLKPCFSPPPAFENQFGTFRSPLLFNDGSQVKIADDWAKRRKEIRDQWMDLMGQWPPLITEPKVKILESETLEPGILCHHVRFLWTPTEETTGLLLIPENTASPRPAVLTVFYDPETAVGRGERKSRATCDFAIQLTRRGFVTLSIGTKEASARGEYSLYWPSIDQVDVQPLSMLACAAANSWYVLASRPEVDSTRIGIIGHSFGGKWAMFASCLFDRFACAVWSDLGIVFDTRPNVNYWDPWYLGFHPKPWRQWAVPTPENPVRGLYPKLLAEGRDLHELHALMAPRPFLVSGGSEDTPARWPALNHSIAVNRLLGCENCVAMQNRPNHTPTVESNEVAYQFFEYFLKP